MSTNFLAFNPPVIEADWILPGTPRLAGSGQLIDALRMEDRIDIATYVLDLYTILTQNADGCNIAQQSTANVTVTVHGRRNNRDMTAKVRAGFPCRYDPRDRVWIGSRRTGIFIFRKFKKCVRYAADW